MYLCPAGRLANLILVFLKDLSGDGLFDILLRRRRVCNIVQTLASLFCFHQSS